MSVANGKIYTLGDVDGASRVIAVSEQDGSVLWKAEIGEAGGHKGYPGSRSTPTVDGGQVFALNQHSDLACVDAQSGKSDLEREPGVRFWRQDDVRMEIQRVTPGGW